MFAAFLRKPPLIRYVSYQRFLSRSSYPLSLKQLPFCVSWLRALNPGAMLFMIQSAFFPPDKIAIFILALASEERGRTVNSWHPKDQSQMGHISAGNLVKSIDLQKCVIGLLLYLVPFAQSLSTRRSSCGFCCCVRRRIYKRPFKDVKF